MSLSPGQPIVVRKLEVAGRQQRLSYPATVVDVTDRSVVVAAESTLDRVAIDGVVILREDQFTEYYYRDRWFNVYHIGSPEGETKGWYCNVATPFETDDLGIAFVDLYLDLFVHPDGHYTVLDQDEFEAVKDELGEQLVQQARAALDELIRIAGAGLLPDRERPGNPLGQPR